MFSIEKNNIPEIFECYYKDEYDNRAHLKRENAGFYMRLKPADKNVSVPVIHVKFPIDRETGGMNMKLLFLDKVNHTNDPDIKAMVKGAGELLNRWIRLVSDTALLGYDRELFHVNDPEEFAKLQLEALTGYEELNRVMNMEELK